MQEFRRWYDNDVVLKEALELLQLQTDDTKDQASQFLIKMQEDVAAEVIEQVAEMVEKYSQTGSRWYDKDPVMLKAIELLRVAPPKTQRKAALKLLLALENNSFDEFLTDENK